MALAKIKKIQLIAIKKHKEKILEILQNAGSLDIQEIGEEKETEKTPYKNIHELQKVELTYANLQFTIDLLSKYAKKKGLFSPPITLSIQETEEKIKKFDYKTIAEQCSEIEEKITKANNNLSSLNNDLSALIPWNKLDIKLENLTGTNNTSVITGSIKSNVYNSILDKLNKISSLTSVETIHSGTIDTYFLIIFNNELVKEVRQVLSENKFTETDLPKEKGLLKDYIESLKNKVEENEKILKEAEKELKELSKNLDDLKITYDYYGWQLEKLQTDKKSSDTEYNFVLNAWIPEDKIPLIEESIENHTKEYSISELKLKKDEIPPVIIKNKNFISPFEAVSKIYGLPRHDELDPTPFLATFFIIFFALCLTDAGYGIIMFIAMALILRFFKLGEGIKKLVRLLMYGGVVTFFIGAIFGGWFGLTADQVPEFLTYTAENGEKMFIFQKINALSNPIAVLLLALSLGFIQVLLGVTMKFVHSFKTGDKKDALFDTGTWVFMLIGIGFFILTSTGILPEFLKVVGTWWVLIAAILLILTQGREKKNIITKFFSGVLSLYGLVGYMSDVLSYSRILALGLATTIIGLAVNIVADLIGGLPYIGWLLMIVVFIGGHIFNLLINALGSFIHSGRLQFVEFFTKFMEGGGNEFKPFSKKSKYIFLKK